MKTAPTKKGPISSIASSLMPVLDELGLSAPVANSNPQRMLLDPFASPATVDTTKTPLKTAYTFKHHLEISQLGIDKNDEMDIPYFCYKPTYLNQFQWNTTQDAGTLLYSYKIEPNCILASVVNNYTLTAPTRLRYMANCFRYWRGTIRFTFHVIANKFHSGRLRFVLSLGGQVGSDRISELYPYAFNQIVDLRDATSYVVDCPFFASTPYRLVPQQWVSSSGSYENPATGTQNLLDAVPYLQIFVENELRAPTTTTTSIQIVALQSGTKDLEFSTPNSTTSFPIVDYVAPSTDTVDSALKAKQKPKKEALEATPVLSKASAEHIAKSVGDVIRPNLQGDMIKPIPMVPGFIAKQVSSDSPHRVTTGERISTIRQLIKRYQLLGSGELNFTEDNNNSQTEVIYPFAFKKPTNQNLISSEMLDYFRHPFVFFRGSIRYLFTSVDSDLMVNLRYDPNSDILDYVTTDDSSLGSKVPTRSITAYQLGQFSSLPLTANIPYVLRLQGGAEVEFPYYSRFHKLGTSSIDQYTSYEQSVRAGYQPAGVGFAEFFSAIPADPNYVNVYRTAADDFSLGYLLGCPWTMVQVVPVN